MEALHNRRLLVQYSYADDPGSGKGFTDVNSCVFPPAAGFGSASYATNYRTGRVSFLSPSISRGSYHSLVSTRSRANNTKSGTSYRFRCTTAAAGLWLFPNGAPSPPGETKFGAESGGKWSLFRSSKCRSTHKVSGQLLLASHPPSNAPTSSGRAYPVIISTTPFGLSQRKPTAPEGPFHKPLKISASSIFYGLKRNRKQLPEIKSLKIVSNGYQRVSLHSFVGYNSNSTATSSQAEWSEHYMSGRHAVGPFRSTSEYYNGYSSVSSQAEGNASLENAVLVDQQKQQQQRLYPDGETKEFLATGYGWKIRDAALGDLQELKKVADIQTGAFHEKSALFDDLFYKIFHAEILSSLQYKFKHSDPGRYSCLLAERDPAQDASLEEPTVVGAVDVTAFTEKNIVCHLPGAEEYLYVSGMAVDSNYRRQGVATVLLEACLARALQWGFDYLVLHAHEDDLRARNLYAKAGYDIVAIDPAWMTTFFGRRRRVIMARRTHERFDSA